MLDEAVKIFVAGGCGFCEDVKRLAKAGRMNQAKIDLIDVTTEEGFKEIEKHKLTQVPCAIKDGKSCKILIDRTDDVLIIDCESSQDAIF
jgi:glutaredoxin